MSKSVRLVCKTGSKKLNSTFEKLLEAVDLGFLDHYGRAGVSALTELTPKDSGETAYAWTYDIVRKQTKNGEIVKLRFKNPVVETSPGASHPVSVAILLQYGHLTGTGGWVEGTDYINPALKPIFEKILDQVKREVANIK